MPGKHVHFGADVRYDVSPKREPSSLPIPGPSTPPAYSKVLPSVRKHHRRATYPSPKPAPPQPHPMLLVAHPRAVNFDLTLPPSTISTSYASLSSRYGLLSESALSTPTTHMTLHLPGPSSQWRIDVRPRSNGAYITVNDVFQAMYYGLRENVTKEEFYGLQNKEAMRRVSAAYEKRYRRLAQTRGYEEERKGGVKRVDFLLGNVWFAGLKPLGLDSWLIHVS